MNKIDITTISIFGKSEDDRGFTILLTDYEKAAIINYLQALHKGDIKVVEIQGLERLK